MVEPAERIVLGVLRIPPEPSPPAGDPRTLRVFRAAPRYLRYRQLIWALKQVGAFGALLGAWLALPLLETVKHGSVVWPWVRLAELFAWGIFLLQLPFSYVALQLDYRLRWYMVTDRSLRVREGIWHLREKTMTFANVQSLSVQQGPLQRLWGLSDVRVESAGGGAASSSRDGEGGLGESGHEARFRGVANAAEIRDLVRDRVRRFRDSGLGDRDDRPIGAREAAGDPLMAAQEVLEEIRALRTTAASLRVSGI